MWLLVGLIIFVFVYICLIIFWITSITFIEKNEDENLMQRVERVHAVVATREVFLENGNKESDAIISSILENTTIIDSSWQYLSHLWDELPDIYIPANVITYYDGFKYYYTMKEKDGINYDILVRNPANNYLDYHIFFMLFLIILSPVLYSLLAFLWCRMMHHVYKPIKEMVINLEWFATNINHEFKTSITEILSSLQLAEVTKEYESGVTHAIGSAKRLNNILDSLGIIISFVNSEYRKEKVNIVSLLNESLQDYQSEIHKKNIQIVRKYESSTIISRYIDKEPLLLCFTNILKNAIRYSHNNGKIEISISKDRFSIKDFWIGIEAGNLENIFERYFRENYRGDGSGIWLSLVKRISERYDWNISVESKKDEFTEFSVEF